MSAGSKSIMSRRSVLMAAGAAVIVGVGGYARSARKFDGDAMDPPSVHAAAVEGDVILVDIRRPDEWSLTGVGEGAAPIDMRRDDFIDALSALTGGDKGAPVALICARGVRSNRLSRRLKDAGFTRIIDVPEGMLGSRAGPGWLERGLPVVKA